MAGFVDPRPGLLLSEVACAAADLPAEQFRVAGQQRRYNSPTALALDPDHVAYTALADLSTATEKARRDAPAIAVCDV